MTDPIFILGCHRSGTSVVAGLLHQACGVSMGELMPATDDNPLGYFETLAVVDAHRDLLFQMERDWTCPPTSFRPEALDLTALKEQVDIHAALDSPWAMKDPRSAFLLPAWSELGVDRVRFVAVARTPSDTVRSIEKRDGIRQDRAEAIVDAYLRRLVEIAEKVDLPVIEFSSDGENVIRQVRDVAGALDLDWDEDAARAFFEPRLVRNQSPLRDSTPTYDELVERAVDPVGATIGSAELATLDLASEPTWPLETHLAVRHAQQRHELWPLANFSTVTEPDVAEFLLDGARLGGGRRRGVGSLHQIEIPSLMSASSELMRRRLRPHGVVGHGLLTGRNETEIEFFFRSAYVATHPLAEMVLDVPSPHGPGLSKSMPAPAVTPRPAHVRSIASRAGWDELTMQRISPGRVGMVFRKRVLTDSELVPVVTDLLSSLDRISSIDVRVRKLEAKLKAARSDVPPKPTPTTDRELRRRAERAEHDLARLRGRRSVKLALRASQPFGHVFRTVRRWKTRS